jgi:hypothetical protein
VLATALYVRLDDLPKAEPSLGVKLPADHCTTGCWAPKLGAPNTTWRTRAGTTAGLPSSGHLHGKD